MAEKVAAERAEARVEVDALTEQLALEERAHAERLSHVEAALTEVLPPLSKLQRA